MPVTSFTWRPTYLPPRLPAWPAPGRAGDAGGLAGAAAALPPPVPPVAGRARGPGCLRAARRGCAGCWGRSKHPTALRCSAAVSVWCCMRSAAVPGPPRSGPAVTCPAPPAPPSAPLNLPPLHCAPSPPISCAVKRMEERQLASLAGLARDIALHRSDADMAMVSGSGGGAVGCSVRSLLLPCSCCRAAGRLACRLACWVASVCMRPGPAILALPAEHAPGCPSRRSRRQVSGPSRGASARDLMQPLFALAAAEAAWRVNNPARYVSPETVSAIITAGALSGGRTRGSGGCACACQAIAGLRAPSPSRLLPTSCFASRRGVSRRPPLPAAQLLLGPGASCPTATPTSWQRSSRPLPPRWASWRRARPPTSAPRPSASCACAPAPAAPAA